MDEFIRQLESCIVIAGTADADRHHYLHLHLEGGALTFDQSLETPDGVAVLRERYQNDQRVEL